MSKWEDKYNELSPKIDDMIKKQKNNIKRMKEKKVNLEKNGESEEAKKQIGELNKAKKEKQRLEKLKLNFKQVSNIIEYRDKLKGQLKELKEEVQRRDNLKQAASRQEALENKIAEYQKRYEEVSKEIKRVNRKLKDLKLEEKDEKAELEEELLNLEIEREEITKEMPKAQEKRDKQEEILKNGLGKKTELSREEIEKKSFDIQSKINKCNLVANCLVNGLSWDSIDMHIDNWKDRKFTAKDGKLADNIKDANREEEQPVKRDDEPLKEMMNQEKGNENPEIDNRTHITDKEVEKIAREQQKLPNLKKATFWDTKIGKAFSKLGRFCKNVGILFKETFINENSKKEISNKPNEKDVEKSVEELQDKLQREQIAETVKEIMGEKSMQKDVKEKPVEELSFKEYIKQIAEKGMAEVEREQREAREKSIREKLAERQRANRDVEEKKFGKAYADMSRTDDGAR